MVWHLILDQGVLGSNPSEAANPSLSPLRISFMDNPDFHKDEKFICDICGEEYASVTDLEEHKIRHSQPRRGLEDEEREIRGDIGAAGLPTSPVV
jgi:hypothetical protein